jgi:hypothetical protein
MVPVVKKSSAGATLKPGKRPAEIVSYGLQRSDIKPLSYKGLSAESIKSA